MNEEIVERIKALEQGNEIVSQLLQKPGVQLAYIPDFNKAYVISNYGDVISLKTEKARILKHIRLASGYYAVTLYKKGVGQRTGNVIGPLVLKSFGHEKPSHSHIVSFKDSNKSNLHIDNLEWLTRSDVFYKAHFTGTINMIKRVRISKGDLILMEGTTTQAAAYLKVSASRLKYLRDSHIEHKGMRVELIETIENKKNI
jgi:translation initiation factor IF-1